MSYEYFAATYDKLMDKQLYDMFYTYVQRYAKKDAKILELACGTGELAMRLAQDYQVIASDLSVNMLTLARQKVPNNVLLLEMDMQESHFTNEFDIVTCFADSICYLADQKAVKRAFQAAYNALKESGVYLFDVHSLLQIDLFKDYAFQYCDDETVFVWQSYEGEHENSIEHDITCCQSVSNGLYERYDETHYQRTYPIDEYLKLLQEVGFKDCQLFMDNLSPIFNDKSKRWFFKAIKK